MQCIGYTTLGNRRDHPSNGSVIKRVHLSAIRGIGRLTKWMVSQSAISRIGIWLLGGLAIHNLPDLPFG